MVQQHNMTNHELPELTTGQAKMWRLNFWFSLCFEITTPVIIETAVA